jgi:hypothetical protein
MVYTHTHIHIHTHTHTHTHTYTHIHTHRRARNSAVSASCSILFQSIVFSVRLPTSSHKSHSSLSLLVLMSLFKIRILNSERHQPTRIYSLKGQLVIKWISKQVEVDIAYRSILVGQWKNGQVFPNRFQVFKAIADVNSLFILLYPLICISVTAEWPLFARAHTHTHTHTHTHEFPHKRMSVL